MAFSILNRCYDSHVHWVETGELRSYIDFSKFKSKSEYFSFFESFTFDENKIIKGFGWDDNKQIGTEYFSCQTLDQIFPKNLIFFIRADGHALWTNSYTWNYFNYGNHLDLPLDQICLDSNGNFSGVMKDRAKELFMAQLPEQSDLEIKEAMLIGQEVFLKNGFTHIRDMAFNLRKWQVARQLEREKKLKLYIEANFSMNKYSELDETIQTIKDCSFQQSAHLRVAGLKFYLDGALGSEGALISGHYKKSELNGFQLYTEEQIENIFRECWSQSIAVAVHALGDLAVDIIIKSALKLKDEGVSGELNIEHAELLSDFAISKLPSLSACIHFQPSHLLSDSKWIEQKVENYQKRFFRWHDLETSQVSFFFGSDSPIESPELMLLKKGLDLGEKIGVKNIDRPWSFYVQHPDPSFGGQCQTKFFEDGTIEVLEAQ